MSLGLGSQHYMAFLHALPLPITIMHSKVFFFFFSPLLFDHTSSFHGRQFPQLKGPFTICMETFCHSNRKPFVSQAKEGLLLLLLQASLNSWAFALETTTLNLPMDDHHLSYIKTFLKKTLAFILRFYHVYNY